MSARVRILPADRVLIAVGSARPGQPTGQLVLIRRSELRHFFGWLARQIEPSTGAAAN